MVYEDCPMFGGGMMGYGGFYLNWILAAIVFALIFWGTYYLLIKGNVQKNKRKK